MNTIDWETQDPNEGTDTPSVEMTIMINGVTRDYVGDYHVLYNNDWNEVIRNFIDNTL